MMAKKPHGPPVIKRDATTSTWRRNVLISVALLLACVLAANTFLGQRAGVAQTTPARGGYGLGSYGGGGYDSGYGEEYRSGYGDEMGYGAGSSMMAGAGPRQELEARVAPLVNRLRNAKDDDQKKAIQSELSGILENYFEQDLRRRSAEIASIEERVQRLKDQCEQRKQAKEEILQLQMKVLQNQAAGLGFFGQAGAGQEMEMGMGNFMGSAMGEMADMEGGYPGGGYAEHGVGEYGMPVATGADPVGRRKPIPQTFQKRTALDFHETPLVDAIDFLRDCSGANIYVDRLELKQAGGDLDQTVTIVLDEVSVATALELITSSLNSDLGVRYDDGIAVIGLRSEPTMVQLNQWGSDGTQRSREVEEHLAKKGDYELDQASLADVLQYLQEAADVNVFLNTDSLKKAGISSDIPVSIRLTDVKHRTALRLVLDSLKKALYYSIVDGIVVVAANHVESPSGQFETIHRGESSDPDPTAAQPETTNTPTDDPEQASGANDIIPKGLAARRGQFGIMSASSAEELAVREAAVDSTAARLKIVEAAFGDGRATALELAEARGEFEIATKRLEGAKRENAAQDRLLELELQRAKLELAAAQASLDENMAINLKSPGTIPSSTIKKAELAVRTTELDVERIQTLLELHREPAGDNPSE